MPSTYQPRTMEQLAARRRAARKRRRGTVRLTPQEEQGLLSSLSQSALSGVARVGNVLDVPGSMVRDILSDENPFDQLLSPTTSANRVQGREMLERAGLLGANQPGLDTGDVAGFLGEVVTDPLSAGTLGAAALGRSGQAARSAGLLDDAARVATKKFGKKIGKRQARLTITPDDLIKASDDPVRATQAIEAAASGMGTSLKTIRNEPLGGLVGLGLPFREPSFVLGRGAKAQKAATVLDRISSRIGATSGARVAKSLFSPKVKGRATQQIQELAADVTRRQGLRNRNAREFMALQTQRLIDSGLTNPGDGRKIRRVLEGIDTPESGSNLEAIAKDFEDYFGELLSRGQRAGMKREELVDNVAKYFPRRLSAPRKAQDAERRALTAFDTGQLSRKDYLRDLPEGTDTIVQLAEDSEINKLIDDGAKVKQIAEAVNRKIPGRTRAAGMADQVKKEAAKLRKLDLGEFSEADQKIFQDVIDMADKIIAEEDQAKQIARLLKNVPKETREAGVFGNHPFDDAFRALRSAEETTVAAEDAIEFLATPGILNDLDESAIDGVKLDTVVKNMGLDSRKSLAAISRKINQRRMKEAGVSPLEVLMGRGNVELANAKSLKEMVIPRDWANDLTGFTDAFKQPESVNKVVQLADSYLNWFKANVTGIFPAFHTRNLFSGQVRNAMIGLWDASSVRAAHAILRGDTLDGAKNITRLQQVWMQQGNKLDNLTDDIATDLLRQQAFADDIIDSRTGIAQEVVGSVPGDAANPLQNLAGPGFFREGVADTRVAGIPEIARRAVAMEPGTTWKPWKVRGVGDEVESTFGPVSAGHEVSHYVEGLNRLSPYIKGLREGKDPTFLSQKIKAAQVDYSSKNFTEFENRFMKRMFPFWSFQSRQIPFVAQELLERPGGRMAQTIRAINEGRAEQDFLPEHVSETASIPLGQLEGGDLRYLTGLGLMLEDPLQFAGDSPGLEMLSRTNPLVRAPLEMATGQLFFQRGPMGGRPLEDADPTIGRTLSNIGDLVSGERTRGKAEPVLGSHLMEQIAAASPLSRILTSARQLSDPRKLEDFRFFPGEAAASNLLTGFRITDISPATQDARLRELLEQQEVGLGGRRFEKVYMPDYAMERLSEEEKEHFRALEALRKEIEKRAKDAKKRRERGQR